LKIQKEKWKVKCMQKGFVNFAFALFAALLLSGGLFADNSTNINQAPVIDSMGGPSLLNISENGTWSIAAHDPDGNYLSYGVDWGDNLKQWQAQPSSNATFQHAYTAAGAYAINFTVTDGNGSTTQATTTVNVQLPANLPPVITGGSGPASLNTSINGTWSITAYDPEGTNLTYSVNWGNGNSTGSAYLAATTYSHAYSSPGTYTITFTAKDSGNATAAMQMQVVVTAPVAANQPPVISGVGGPAEITAGAVGTWNISAYDPDGAYLSYKVNWGDEGTVLRAAYQSQQSVGAWFQHTYARTGNYTITFEAADSIGATAQYTLGVKVNSGTQSGKINAAVSAIPQEADRYDSIYVSGTVTRGNDSSDGGQNTYVVVLSFDNKNAISNVFGSLIGSSIGTDQARTEEIVLAQGESRDVSAYFTASKLGTNFARIAVYQKSGSARGGYMLVASDTVKVQVKDSGSIPSPPGEKMTIRLEKGWNQVSVPTNYSITPQDMASKCDISTSTWYYSPAINQYSAAAELGRGQTGYWIKANSACNYELDAPYASPSTFSLQSGWNMIGAPLQSTAISSFTGDCRITSGPWHYSPSAGKYSYSSTLSPGMGYWLKVSGDCTLGTSDGMPPAAPTGQGVATSQTRATSTKKADNNSHQNNGRDND
jgi:hypothetical protein